MNKILQNFRNARIAVIGDPMLDSTWLGEVKRVSPEAPVPVFKFERDYDTPGGAANVAANVHSLGGQVTFYGPIGEDDAGKALRTLLRHINFIPTYSGKTVQKIRLIAQRGYQTQRIDVEKEFEPTTLDLTDIEKAHMIIISDYAKGTITRELVYQLPENIPILIDPAPQNRDIYPNCFLMTPNEQEALQMTGTNNVYEAATRLQERFDSNIIITRGKKGMLIFPLNGEPREIPTSAKEVYDVTGAGDTVIAALALSLASDATLEQALIIANHAAGLVVQKRGTATVQLPELESILLKEESKIINNKHNLRETITRYRAQGRNIVWTNGCFDILHEGHVRYLRSAKQLGSLLVVGLNSDSSVRQLKGPGRPIQSEQSRAEILAALESVDIVTIFSETNVAELLDYIRPDIFVKASDYNRETMDQEERGVIENYGGKIEFVPIEIYTSSSEIINRMR